MNDTPAVTTLAPPGRRPRRLPRRTLALVSLLGPVIALATLVWVPVPPFPVWTALVAVALATAVYLTPVPLGLHSSMNLDDVVLVLALAYLPGAVVPVSLTLGMIIAQSLVRRPPVKIAFNAGVQMVSLSAAIGAAHLLGFDSLPLEAQGLLAILASLVHVLGTVVLVSLVTARLDGVSLTKRLLALFRSGLAFTAGSAAYGLLTLFAMQASPAALPVAVGVAGLFLARYRSQSANRLDRERRLVDTARSLHHADDLQQFERIVATAVRDLFGADDARLTPASGPLREGVQVDLPGRTERLELVGLPGDMPVDQDQRDLLATLGSLVAAALDRLGTLEKLGRESEHDPLTDAYNRRRFERESRQRVATAQPHVLAFLDLDGFKALNDSAGHQAGDAVLRELVTDLRTAFRDGDGVFRLGGDEFAVLLTNVPVDVARERFQAFLAGREARAREDDASRLPPVGLSIGLAAYPDHALDEDALVREADAALYVVKRRGGNAVAVAEPA